MAKKEKKSGMGGEFKKFLLRGNVVDLAVGVIIGGAFSKITASLVGDVLMPLIGMLLGGIDFSKLNIELPALFPGKDSVMLNLGTFITTVIDFVVIAFVIFMLVKGINKLRERKKEEPAPAAPPEPSTEEKLLTEIRDLLRDKN